MSQFGIGHLLGFTLGMEHYLFIGILIAIWKKNKGFFVDWLPYIILIMVYNMMRGVADNLNYINVTPVYNLEYKLFAWMFGGKIPAFWAQEHQTITMTIIFSLYYSLHAFFPLAVGLSIYYKSNDRDTFKEFSFALLLASYLALITFALYPVAPPWYIYNEGGPLNFAQPLQKTGVRESAANLLSTDKYFATNVFGDFYKTFNMNPYAAVPSLHAAYSFFTAYYAITKYRKSHGKKIWLFLLYPMGVWTAAVYLNHHFIVDLLAGAIYAYGSIRIVRFIRNRRAKKTDTKEDVLAEAGTENLLEGTQDDNGKSLIQEKPTPEENVLTNKSVIESD